MKPYVFKSWKGLKNVLMEEKHQCGNQINSLHKQDKNCITLTVCGRKKKLFIQYFSGYKKIVIVERKTLPPYSIDTVNSRLRSNLPFIFAMSGFSVGPDDACHQAQAQAQSGFLHGRYIRRSLIIKQEVNWHCIVCLALSGALGITSIPRLFSLYSPPKIKLFIKVAVVSGQTEIPKLNEAIKHIKVKGNRWICEIHQIFIWSLTSWINSRLKVFIRIPVLESPSAL